MGAITKDFVTRFEPLTKCSHVVPCRSVGRPLHFYYYSWSYLSSCSIVCFTI